MDAKIKFMRKWAEQQGARLDLDGECGFGRQCVGILVGTDLQAQYPEWRDAEAFWDDEQPAAWETPAAFPPASVTDNYDKASVLCVLGRGADSIDQLYDWVKQLAENKLADANYSCYLASSGEIRYVDWSLRRIVLDDALRGNSFEQAVKAQSWWPTSPAVWVVLAATSKQSPVDQIYAEFKSTTPTTLTLESFTRLVSETKKSKLVPEIENA